MITKLLPLVSAILLSAFCIVAVHNKINTKPDFIDKTDVSDLTGIQKQNPATYITTLQESNWYASAMSSIAQSEYYFKKIDNGYCYSTPNRKNNLRFFYNEDGFITIPRTTALPNEKPDATTHLPEWKVAFNIDKSQLGKGKWNVAENKAEYITDNITVQYINNENGMRQNFIVAAPLNNSNELKINFSIKTNLKTVLQNNQLQFFHHKAGNVLNYSDLKVWDANGKTLAANFENNKNSYCINVNTKDAAYPITIDPISSSPSTILESNQATAAMGCAVSSAGDVNGDGYSDVLVGAYLFDNGETDEGRVFVYHGSSSGISTTAAATLEVNQTNSKFGYSVSSAGDINGDGYSDVIVGAYFYDNGETDEGAAFIYRGSSTGINSSSFTILQSNQASAQFGISVSGAGDVNDDGYSDVIVGANGYDNGQLNEGAAFIFHGNTSGINTVAASVLESNKASSFMGVSVASAGDVNGDGYSDVIAGAASYFNGVGQTGEGAAFVYHGSASGVNVTATAILESNQANAGMGQSVSSAGDVNGDGYSDIIIGAFNYDKGQTDEGVAFIYNGTATGISLIAADTLESNQASAKAGRAVASAGDINGDGYSDVMVGAFLFDNGETDEGTVFVYKGTATGINNTSSDTLQSNQADAQMGIAVASAGDVNGDGYSDIIAGAWNYDNGQADEGIAFIYTGSAGNISKAAVYTFTNSQQSSLFGYSVASAGDVNGDGYTDIIIGARQYDNIQTNEGAVFIYHGDSTGLNSSPALIIESNSSNAFFGCSVASAGDVNGDGYSDIIVGAYNYSNGQTGEGAAFIYHGSANGIVATPATIMEGNAVSANMGFAVSSAGDVNADGFSDVIVGVSGYTNGQTLEGGAFVYHGGTNGIQTTATIQLEINQANAEMGCAVASAGDINGDGYGDIMVAAKKYDNGQTNEGAVFIYHGSATGISSITTTIESNTINGEIGNSVATAGDVNGDGYSDVVVGGNFFTNNQITGGMCVVYYGTASGINIASADTLTRNNPAAQFGFSVASAGDVNGDGYSDVVVGAPVYYHGGYESGGVFVYHGSLNGIDPIATDSLFSNQQSSYFGNSVAPVGDLNRDGYSDLIIGAYIYSNGLVNGGATMIYYGNDGGKRNNLTLYNDNLQTPLQQSNTGSLFFGAGQYAKSSLGRQKAKLVWEKKKEGNPFSGSPITNSTASTGQTAAYTDLGVAGVELKEETNKLFPAKSTYIRTRIKYNPATAITGQMYGPWRYPANFASGTRNFNLSAITYEWTGLVSTAWENSGNWSSLVVPGIASEVLIPAGRPRYPVINTNTSIKSLTVSQGASTTVAPGVIVNIVGQ